MAQMLVEFVLLNIQVTYRQARKYCSTVGPPVGSRPDKGFQERLLVQV